MADGTSESLTEREQDLARRLVEQLECFNSEAAGAGDLREFILVETDGHEELVGGVYGWTWGGTCWIEALWVREDARGRGLGRRLMLAVQEEARRRGCHQMALDSHTYQAPAFYERLGFDVVGEIPDFPAGHSKFLFRKVLGDP
jgi:ribosomal protein S18 acetylase RimI-like enzyme